MALRRYASEVLRRCSVMRSALRIAGAALATSAVAASTTSCAEPPRPASPPAPVILGAFTLREHLGHRWDDELLHFDVEVPDREDLSLVNDRGEPVPSQIEPIEPLVSAGGKRRARVWTVASLAPRSQIGFALRAGAPAAIASSSLASITEEDGALVLQNGSVAVALPRLSAPLTGSAPPRLAPLDLRSMPPPIRAVRVAHGPWLGSARWVNEGDPVLVSRAETEIVERGPVRVTVRQRMLFAGGGSYAAQISLGAAQEVAEVIEDADVRAPKAALLISMAPGLAANRVFWQSQWKAPEGSPPWAVLDSAVAFDRDRVVARLRPWTFMWLPSVTAWAGFHSGSRADRALAGVIALRPSRWSPPQWDGFDRTEIPITARSSGGIDLTFVLDAGKEGVADRGPPLHREWAITAGLAADHLTTDGAKARLRRLLIKHGELPLDVVKGFSLDYQPAPREHPSLLFGRADLDRVRRLAKSDPLVAAEVARVITKMNGCGGCVDRALAQGSSAIFDTFLRFHFHSELPTAYLGSDDPRWGRFLGGVVEGLAKRVVSLFLEAPERPSLGALGPWYSEFVTQLALMLDLVAGTPYLSPEKEAEARAALVLGAEVLSHPDYWNVDRGLASANPNMTASMILPRGLLAFALAGHPRAERWMREAEAHFESELSQWISPGGAWVENPHYQLASLDSLLTLATVLQRAGRGDPFNDPRLRATMEYFGFLLTPPDRRFPSAPMTLPSIGDAFSGDTSLFNGWMARATFTQDPDFSARQAWYWQAQGRSLHNAGRADGLALALTDPSLPARPPEQRAAAFPGFGTISRSSWVDPRQSYLAHRTGPHVHHYHADAGSFVYYAKGAPLCVDWGNYYSPRSRGEPWYHSMVSFSSLGAPQHLNIRGELKGFAALPGFLTWSSGETSGAAGEVSERHLLFIESTDPMGANYLVIRDTAAGAAGKVFHQSTWALADRPEVRGADIHFPGRLGVDLEVSVLAPRDPEITVDHWAWKETIPRYGPFSEDQWGIHVKSLTSPEGFFTVLYPRAGKEPLPRAAAVSSASPGAAFRLGSASPGAAARVSHGEGTDLVLVSPGKPTSARDGGVVLTGEIAFARRYRSGAARLALVTPAPGEAEIDGWSLSGEGPAALEIKGRVATGVVRGAARTLVITLPPSFNAGRGAASVSLDGRAFAAAREGRRLTLAIPAGDHRLEVRHEARHGP